MEQQELKIGTRYWLDPMEDISGVYCGDDHRGYPHFRELVNNYCYEEDDDGKVGFIQKYDFEEV